MAIIGAQYSSPSVTDTTGIATIKRFIASAPEAVRPSFWEVASVTDKKGAWNVAVLAYWPGGDSFWETWQYESGFKIWWQSADRERDGHGWFVEVLCPTIDRFETVFSNNAHPEGAANMQEKISGEILEHAYWGSMRDRFAAAQDDELKGERWTALPESANGNAISSSNRICVSGKKNLCVIRSGQDWSGTLPAERKLYLETMHPVLIEGMNFLRDSGKEVGCYVMNLWDVVDSESLEVNRERTFGLGFFDDLASLEFWSKSHQTHINIFGGFLMYAKKLNNVLSLRLFHEIYVLEEGQQFFEVKNGRGKRRITRSQGSGSKLSKLLQPYAPPAGTTTPLNAPTSNPKHLTPHLDQFTMADFAPYQDVPETARALSPPLTSPRASLDRTRNIGTTSVTSPTNPSYQQRDYFGGDGDEEEQRTERVAWNAPSFGGPREDLDMFSTSVGLRMDYAACLAYLALPPAGPVVLLILEHRSDYVRFHAWQSSLLFAFVFVIHIIFSWSSIISWLLLVGDLGLIGFLTMHAYQDGMSVLLSKDVDADQYVASSLDRYEIPFFGPLASSITDDE
ncbi:hypothetical protein N0V90_000539 [Kalmusia sp. IMI 367209]|nr:hypothetical protein N0V90_000539 [Kalmusia sp. IMI 367209]